jgi:hypothetical protein
MREVQQFAVTALGFFGSLQVGGARAARPRPRYPLIV